MTVMRFLLDVTTLPPIEGTGYAVIVFCSASGRFFYSGPPVFPVTGSDNVIRPLHPDGLRLIPDRLDFYLRQGESLGFVDPNETTTGPAQDIE